MLTPLLSSDGITDTATCFAQIVDDLATKGFSVINDALSPLLTAQLYTYQQAMQADMYARAGIGREQQFQQNKAVRKDEICWIDGTSEAGAQWLAWADALRVYLNRHLYMGLFSFESHFAHYAPGAFYRRHLDAFNGESNRVLSLVTYLNADWQDDDGGELIIYPEVGATSGVAIKPDLGTVAVFLSEKFEHEVLPAKRDRYSIAGWFRLNTSINGKIDPPR